MASQCSVLYLAILFLELQLLLLQLLQFGTQLRMERGEGMGEWGVGHNGVGTFLNISHYPIDAVYTHKKVEMG